MPASSPDNRPSPPEAHSHTRNSLGDKGLGGFSFRLHGLSRSLVIGAGLVLALTLTGCEDANDSFTGVCQSMGTPVYLVVWILFACLVGSGLGLWAWLLYKKALETWDMSKSSSAPTLIGTSNVSWVWVVCGFLLLSIVFLSLLATENCAPEDSAIAALTWVFFLLAGMVVTIWVFWDRWRKGHSNSDNL